MEQVSNSSRRALCFNGADWKSATRANGNGHSGKWKRVQWTADTANAHLEAMGATGGSVESEQEDVLRILGARRAWTRPRPSTQMVHPLHHTQEDEATGTPEKGAGTGWENREKAVGVLWSRRRPPLQSQARERGQCWLFQCC